MSRSGASPDNAVVEGLVPCSLLVPRFVAQGGYRLRVVGNIPQLGQWQASGAVDLLPSDKDKNMYSANVQLPLGKKIEAKVS